MMITTAQAYAVADATTDAYSFDRYGRQEWRKAAARLAQRHYTAEQIEAILRSKTTRWAADAAGRAHGATTAADLLAYIDDNPRELSKMRLADLVATLHPTGSDLAGACEGEDIADLIDLARTLKNIGGPAAVNLRASQILDRIEQRYRSCR